MAGQFGFFPGIQVGRDFPPQGIHPLMQLMNFLAGLLILPGCRFEVGNLLFDLL